jgi:hypothetical protein
MAMPVSISDHHNSVNAESVAKPNFTSLVQLIRSTLDGLPDHRRESNGTKYKMGDAGLSAFSVFFSQSPSILDWQIRMQQAHGKNNANSIFGVHQIPSDAQIRNLLDPVPPEILFPAMASIGDTLYDLGYLDSYRSIGKTFLVALDGTDFFSSENISCSCCTQSKHKDGSISYRHIAVTPVIVAPGHEKVIALPPEFVTPQDGHDKQDCELAAAQRWLNKWGAHYAARGMTVIGDDLYCHQPFCRKVLAQLAHYLLVCKPESHATLYEWVDDLSHNGTINTVTISRRVGRKQFIDTYRYASDLPLTNSDDALLVNWLELVTTNESGKVTYRNGWATSHPIDAKNVAELAAAGRARWKIENENNNTLKTKGYHFEHNFGHGKKHLANLLATMILLAFLVHTALDWLDLKYRAVRGRLPSRRTFFEHIRALLLYLPFDDWDHLMTFMLSRLDQHPPKTG